MSSLFESVQATGKTIASPIPGISLVKLPFTMINHKANYSLYKHIQARFENVLHPIGNKASRLTPAFCFIPAIFFSCCPFDKYGT